MPLFSFHEFTLVFPGDNLYSKQLVRELVILRQTSDAHSAHGLSLCNKWIKTGIWEHGSIISTAHKLSRILLKAPGEEEHNSYS